MPASVNSIPQSVVESWPTPNYVDPVRRGWMPAFALTWQVASSILLFGRFYLRVRKQAGSFGLDDAMIFVGWLFSIGFTTTALLGTERFNLDRHTWDANPHSFVGTALISWIAQVMFIFSTVPTKLSVLLFYRRMVKDTLDHRWLYALYVAIFITTAYGLAIFITYCLMCQPLDAYWLSSDISYTRSHRCVDWDALTVTSGSLSVFSDLYAVALPCAMLRHYDLDVPRRQKIALNAIFAMGLLVTGAGIGRTYHLWKITHAYDASWVGFDIFAWSLVECQLAIICACAPSLRAFFRHYLRNRVKRGFSSVSYYASGGRRRECTPDEGDARLQHEKDLESGSNTHSRADGEDNEPSSRQSSERTLSDDGHQIRTPEDYELYCIERFSRHGSKCSRGALGLDSERLGVVGQLKEPLPCTKGCR